MATHVTDHALIRRRPGAHDEAAALAAEERADAWPHTTRVLPWLLAGFLVMLWLVPFQDVSVPVTLPFGAKLDRFLLGAIVLVWLPALLVGGRTAPRLRPNALNVAVIAFVVIATASVLINLDVLVNTDDFALAMKKLALLIAYVTFFFVASTSLRPAEVRPFCMLMLGLACVMALGIVWEYRASVNLFYDYTQRLLPPGFSVAPETGDSKFARPAVTGPSQHGLAATTMLGLALPFAVVALVEARRRAHRIAFALVAALMFAGAVSTLRRTGLIVPAAALLVLLVYRRRELLRLAPLGLVLVALIPVLSPDALGSIRDSLRPGTVTTDASIQGRTQDYDAVRPDVEAHLATGRGYGTYDSHKYRLLDNQYLVLLIETGFLGIAAYIGIMLAVVLVAHPTIRSRDPVRAPPALAAAAGAGAFLVCGALFDVLAFAQVPYLFLFVAALAVVAAAGDRGNASPSSRRSLLR